MKTSLKIWTVLKMSVTFGILFVTHYEQHPAPLCFIIIVTLQQLTGCCIHHVLCCRLCLCFGWQGDVYISQPHSACNPVQPSTCGAYEMCFLLIADDRKCSFDRKVDSFAQTVISFHRYHVMVLGDLCPRVKCSMRPVSIWTATSLITFYSLSL